MGKLVKLTCVVFIVLFFLWVSQDPALAHHRKKVLGDSTTSSELVFPPVTSGPGFILPDSPLYFLDQVFQAAKLATAFDSQAKAKVRAQIAGERLAELRIMLSRNRPEGINTALDQLTKETGAASRNLSDAAASGQNVSTLARELNETIKVQRQLLGALENQTAGTLRLQFKTARRALKEAKVEVEDQLPEDELEKEIEEGLEDEVEEEVEEASRSARKIERDLEGLNREASEAAKKALKRREETLRKAIEDKNEEIKKSEERLFEEEKRKQGKVLEVRKEVAEQARKAIKEAQEAAKKFEKAVEKTREVKNTPVGGPGSSSSGSSGSERSGDDSSKSGSSSSSGSSGSGSSGSGSSGSGSSGSGSSGSGSSGRSED